MNRYLILELQPFSFRMTDIQRDNIGKQIIINEHYHFNTFSELKQKLTNYPITAINKIIIGIGSNFATTDFICQKLNRRRNQSINESELESLITRLINKNLPADQLYIRNITLHDHENHKGQENNKGHKTVDPIGLSNEGDLEIHFSHAQINQKLLVALKKLLPADKILLIGDAGSLWTHILSQLLPANTPFILATSSYNVTALYSHRRGLINRCQQFNWGEKNLLSTLFGRLAVSQPAAREILKMYCQGEISSSLSNKLNNFFTDEFQNLSQQLRSASVKENISQIYFLPLFNLPGKQLKLGRGLKSTLVDNRFVVRKLGFELELKSKRETATDNLLSALLLVAELDTIPINSFVNKIASRRLRWIQ